MNTLQYLNAPTASERLRNLQTLVDAETEKPRFSDVFVNNHIHTTYSFSPYSPTAAVYFARAASLPAAGIVDHDSIAGAREFIRAGEIAGVATTVGVECRVHMTGTPLEDRFINNTDQPGIAYMVLHGVPHGQIDRVQAFFAPLREKRNARNREMVCNINALLSDAGIVLDFDRDVLPLSQYANGGSVTERHLIFALCRAITALCGREKTARFVENVLSVPLSEKQRAYLTDADNPYFDYDLLGVLKSAFVSRIYVPAAAECPHATELAALAAETGALLCYAYLGDVTVSATGDKRSGKFEDDYLDELFEVLRRFNVDAVTYMPSRNTLAQLRRVQQMCADGGFLQISGEDVNSPRQKFVCAQLEMPEFRHLTDATWALIERERALSE
ncbi:MAG: PHP domain-containing protein [Clostridia bacterium]|nr:PHP domain-containing protein [Clostridia bacterium]